MVFIGYEEGTKGYRVFNPGTGRVHVSRDVVFDEGACWKWDDATAAPEPFTVSYTVSVTRPECLEDGGAGASPAARSPAREPVTPGSAREDTEEDAAPQSEARTDADAEGSDRGGDQGGHPMLTRGKDGIHQRNTKYDDDYVHLVDVVDDDEAADPVCRVVGEEPASFPEAAAQQCWLRAMRE